MPRSLRFSSLLLANPFARASVKEPPPARHPDGYAFSDILAPAEIPSPLLTIHSIAMIGAVHDGAGHLWEDDLRLLENITGYLSRDRIAVAANAVVYPMSLAYDEDFLRLQPQVDMAVLCYILDDIKNEFHNRAKTSFRAQSPVTQGFDCAARYNKWRDALVLSNAKIIASLGHPLEISIKKVAPIDFIMLLDPEQPCKDLPPVPGKPSSKQKSYGLVVHRDIAELLQIKVEPVAAP